MLTLARIGLGELFRVWWFVAGGKACMRQSTALRPCASLFPGGKVPPMKLARDDRSLIAWMLYASVLFSLFACGIHHGQMSGLALSGLDGGYCGMNSDAGPSVDMGSSDQKHHSLPSFSCPLCSSTALVVAISSHHWNLDYLPKSAVAPIVARSWAQPPPRYSWPSLNPRASPSQLPVL